MLLCMRSQESGQKQSENNARIIKPGERVRNLMLKVFAQQMLWHFRSFGSTFTIKVCFTLLINLLLDFGLGNCD